MSRRPIGDILSLLVFLLLSSCGGGSSSSTVRLTSIEITPTDLSVPKGQAVTFSAMGRFSDGSASNLNGFVTWASSATSVATLNTNGLASTLVQGSTTINAKLDGITSNSSALTVTAPVLSAIKINLTTATLVIGSTTRFTATGIYTDSSTANVTNQVSWASDNTSAALINSTTGVATGVAVGSANISASLAGITSPGTSLAVYGAKGISFSKPFFLNYWWPISIDDTNHDNFYELFGTYSTASGILMNPDINVVLAEIISPGREMRDLRYADLNNDGILDIISNVYSENNSDSFIKLLWGSLDGTFTNAPVFSTNKFSGYGETIVVADFDNDGYLDIFIPQYQTGAGPYSRNLLFHNRQNGLFDEIALDAGCAFSITIPEGAQAVDYDLDGFIDIYVGSSLFKNLGGFQFVDVTTSSGLPRIFDEGAKFFDFNDDGHLDLLLHQQNAGPRLFLGDAAFKFTEVTNIFPSDYFQFSYGMNVGDVNSDGHDDILLAGGYDINGQRRPPRLWLYKEGKYIDKYFIESFSVLDWSDLVSFGDLDNNGSLDIILRYGKNVIFTNNNIPNYYVKVIVLDNGLRNQQGRVVIAKYDNGKTKAFTVDGGSGFLSIQPYPILVANDSGEQISFRVYCSNKLLEFSAAEGSYEVDCSLSSVVKLSASN